MFELTNEQRKCFGLVPVRDDWERMEAKPSPYDKIKTYLYIDGDTIVKCILCGETQYCEYELFEQVSHDRKYLLPKTQRGKPVLLSSSTILKRKGKGMSLCYIEKCITLYCDNNECTYYSNCYLKDDICNLTAFSKWVEKWCNETTAADVEDIIRFSKKERKHVRYQEGDVFRFKLDRRLYGYGRILLDYDKMRKKKEPFWDILMSKPLVYSVYHIVTERSDVSIDELKLLSSLPSAVVADNSLYYGEYEIIGNIPISDNEDYPIMYGSSIDIHEKALCYQCGKTYRRIENATALYTGFKNNGVSFSLHLTLEVLRQCIEEKSNQPYWDNYYTHWVESDLRNPKNADKLQEIKAQLML